MSPEIVILAAGRGTRMRSDLPKVLHAVGGRPLLRYALDAAFALRPRRVHVITGSGAEAVEAYLATLPAEARALTRSVRQPELRGTADAVGRALPEIPDDAPVLILCGDTPLAPPTELGELLARLSAADLALLTVSVPDPTGYGRVIRDPDGNLTRIVEEKDATPAERAIREINTGIMAVGAARLRQFLPRITATNAQGEYYLTDLIGLMHAAGCRLTAAIGAEPAAYAGVNSPRQLAAMERYLQRRRAGELLDAGVTLLDPGRLDVRGDLQCGRDVVIDVNCVFCGRVRLGDRVRVGAGCVITDCTLGDGCVVAPYSVLERSELEAGVTVGPFARLRPGNVLGAGAHVGNFVEIKNSRLGPGTKAGHLTYVGDADVGARVNLGAGTITCNYDGAFKHRTVIGDDAFIGSDTQLVAPVTVAPGVTVGAGTTVTARCAPPAGSLLITRARAQIFRDYVRPRKDDRA